MPIDASALTQDRLPRWAEEPPVPSGGSLVPGSQFHEDQWIMAAGMLARGNSFLQVSRAMGCSRTTLWRAYYGSKDLRIRVWWEREALNREAELRLSSLRALVAEQIERLVSAGDPSTVRWLAERLGLFAGLDAPAAGDRRRPPSPSPALSTAAGLAPAASAEAVSDPAGRRPSPPRRDPGVPADRPAVTVPELDDEHPGAWRERTPRDPAIVAAILARPEAAGPKAVHPWAFNPQEDFPNLVPEPVSRRGAGAFPRTL
ncbi:hypothetical protein [Azospirillum picis]|uniref:Homeodomain-like domain-containing protein n=1 Tax=Azospirillum picis TaxID=488438 RepID=A0ABU0MSE6_9PROT|nr:hypothetical protein [Azospirillum picis]MBP2301936.1 hypothetical protein [Azospirillum picis]MDQ0536385.1 hypothetical protein [Azospirillum picis]